MSKVWEFIKSLFSHLGRFILRYPIATIVTILLVAGAIFFAVFGKTFQIGGLLSKLWGATSKLPDVKNIPPDGRKDANGQVIPEGQSDDKGWVQQPITTDIKQPGIFDNPNVVTVIHPDKGEVQIPLPTGVQNKDVQQVTEIQPDIYEVHSNDQGVDTKNVLQILGAS